MLRLVAEVHGPQKLHLDNWTHKYLEMTLRTFALIVIIICDNINFAVCALFHSRKATRKRPEPDQSQPGRHGILFVHRV